MRLSTRFGATIQTWSRPTAAYVHGDGFTEVIEMPYPQIMNTTIDTSVCGADHSVTAYYEVLHDRVYDVGDAFNGSIQIICPVLNTDYQLFYSICSDYCQSYLDGTIMFNVTSFNDTEDYFLLTIEPDDLLNISGDWHFYADLTKRNETTGYFSDPVGVVTSMDIRDLLVVGNSFTLFEEDDPDTVPSYLDACVNTPAGQTVDERGCAFDYDAESDEDADGVLDKNDHCPDTATGVSVDASGCGANPPSDTDADGFIDRYDVFPNDPTEWKDSDGDGVGDNADLHPNDPNETLDSDGDGVGDTRTSSPTTPMRPWIQMAMGWATTRTSSLTTPTRLWIRTAMGSVTMRTSSPTTPMRPWIRTAMGWVTTPMPSPMMGTRRWIRTAMALGTMPMPCRMMPMKRWMGMATVWVTMPMPSPTTATRRWIPTAMVWVTMPMPSQPMHPNRAMLTVTDSGTTQWESGPTHASMFMGIPPSIVGDASIWMAMDTPTQMMMLLHTRMELRMPSPMTQVNGRIQTATDSGISRIWPNDMYRWEDTDSDGFDDNSDVCPDEAGSSTIDQLGCLDRDGDGVSDQYDSEPDDLEGAFTSEFVRTTLAGRYDFYTRGPNGTPRVWRIGIRYRSEW